MKKYSSASDSLRPGQLDKMVSKIKDSKPKVYKDYPETHTQGIISFEQNMEMKTFKGDFGIQIAKDGRVWICIDGIALIRFRPIMGEKNE